MKTPGQLLSQHLQVLIRQNRRVSMRSIAQKLGVSAAFLARVLKDQTPFPVKRFDEFAQVFKVDLISQEQLLDSIANDLLKAKIYDQIKGGEHRRRRLQPSAASHDDDFDLIPERDFDLLTRWYLPAILDLTTCSDFNSDPQWIARKLGLEVEVVDHAIQVLLQRGYIKVKDGQLAKKTQKMRFPTKRSMQSIRSFHRQMLRKAERVLLDPKVDFDQRVVNGIFVAADPNKITAAKTILNKALYEIAELMAEGECTEVYYIAGHLFPVTK